MIDTDVPSSVYVFNVNTHNDIKEKILEGISEMGIHSHIIADQCISNTDWHLGQHVNRPYADLFIEAIQESLLEFSSNLEGRAELDNYWFQQYNKGDYHGWHRHSRCMYSCVYYVNLPNKEVATKFKFNNEEFSINVEEGQVLIFPAYLQHCSPKNNFDDTKTVIAFNISLED